VSRRLRIGVLGPPPVEDELHAQQVTYQDAQFLAMREHADVVFGPEALAGIQDHDAVIAFDERQLLIDLAPSLPRRLQPLLVFVTHDYWCHPVAVAELLSGYERVLSVVRHAGAQRLYGLLMPEVPCSVQRPGVDTDLYRRATTPKQWDILISGRETDDYPVRRRLNAVVRDQAQRRGWKVLDLPRQVGAPHGGYAETLASAKVSPTGTPRGGLGAQLVLQYVDASTGRLDLAADAPGLAGDPFYSYDLPAVAVRSFPVGGPPPRYLESMACGTLLVGDLPAGDDWYRDKMVPVSLGDSDEQLGDLIDHWVRSDAERERLCDHAYTETMRTETTRLRAAELVELIRGHC